MGGAVGGLCATGLLLAVRSLGSSRRLDPATRVLPYLRDLPGWGGAPGGPSDARADLLRRAADVVDRMVGGSVSVRRRLARLGGERSVHDLRVEQVAWGLVAFASVAALSILRATTGEASVLGALFLCSAAFVFGVLLRDNRLTAQVRRRERRILAELPAISELLALSVAAGEGTTAALDRVVRCSRGELAVELAAVLAQVRTGTPVAQAFDALAARTGVPEVRRFADAIAVAVERGTPLADVLHAQAGDVRDAMRRQLIESGARREVLMMVPVVFLVLPATVLVAFWPGVVGLSFVTA